MYGRSSTAHLAGFEVQTGSIPTSHSVANRPAAWTDVSRSSPVPVLVKPCASFGGLTTTVPASISKRLVADAESGRSRLHDEDLGIWMSVQLWTDARLRVDENDRERHIFVIGAHELVSVGFVRRSSTDDRGHCEFPFDAAARLTGTSGPTGLQDLTNLDGTVLDGHLRGPVGGLVDRGRLMTSSEARDLIRSC